MRNSKKTSIIVLIIASFVIGIVFADPSRLNQFSDSVRDVPKNIPLPKDTERVPITTYDNCKTFFRTDLKFIETTCQTQKFKFVLPTQIEEAFPRQAMFNVDSKIYQYDNNDFELGLFDQVGEKIYKVSLWEFP
jgi:hypothetical protein